MIAPIPTFEGVREFADEFMIEGCDPGPSEA
jgi:hypothetical protein